MFVASQSPAERQHLIEALRFELGKVTRKAIRSRMLGVLREIDRDLAESVSVAVGVPVPTGPVEVPAGTSAPGPAGKNGGITASAALSLETQPRTTIATRKIAMLIAEGFDGDAAAVVRKVLADLGAIVDVIAPVLGAIPAETGAALEADKTYKTAASVFYDAIFVPGGELSVAALEANGDAIHFIQEAYKHCKPIAAVGEAVDLVILAELEDTALADDEAADGGAMAVVSDQGIVTSRAPELVAELAEAFVRAIAMHRHWSRDVDAVPA